VSAPAVMPRSFLYVPADKPELFTKATLGGADAVIFDLEDAVPQHRKEEARAALREWLTVGRPEAVQGGVTQQLWVRVGADTMPDDLDAVVHPSLDGIMQAKSSAENLASLDAALSSRGVTGSDEWMVAVIALVEDASALEDLPAIARSPRLVSLAIGEVDLLADLRMARSSLSEPAVDSIRTRIVVASASARLQAPIAPTSTAIRQLAEFEQSTLKMRDLGFRSRTAVHPSQLPIIHRVFTPSIDDVAAARDVISRFRLASGGVATDAAGRMIDAAVIRGAEDTLARSSAVPPSETN
jgi:citrate lyase subunit beta/citryl-CoA lyase